jgi:hypothetical protein
MMLCVVRLPSRSDVLKVHMREMTMMPFIDAQPRWCYDGMMMQMFPLIGDLAVLEHDGHTPGAEALLALPWPFHHRDGNEWGVVSAHG